MLEWLSAPFLRRGTPTGEMAVRGNDAPLHPSLIPPLSHIMTMPIGQSLNFDAP